MAEAVKGAQGHVGEGEDLAGFAQAIRRERAKVYRDQVRSQEQFYGELKALSEAWVPQAGCRLVVTGAGQAHRRAPHPEGGGALAAVPAWTAFSWPKRE